LRRTGSLTVSVAIGIQPRVTVKTPRRIESGLIVAADPA